MYSQVDSISIDELISKIKNHIHTNFVYEDIKQTSTESGVSNSILYVNEFLFSLEKGMDFNLNGNIDIEHIMPQSGAQVLYGKCFKMKNTRVMLCFRKPIPLIS